MSFRGCPSCMTSLLFFVLRLVALAFSGGKNVDERFEQAFGSHLGVST